MTSARTTTSERFSRQVALPGFGPLAQRRLAEAHVVVVGAGGLGSILLPALAAAGVGSLTIVDDDRVEASNLHRQTLHTEADIGRPKVDSAADRLAALAPDCRISRLAERLTRENAERLCSGATLLVDASDNFPTRYLLDDLGTLAGVPVVWGSVSQYAGQVGIGYAARGPRYRDVFPVPPPPGSVVSCADGGVLPMVCGVIGSLMAAESVKLLTGIGRPLIGRVATYDTLTGGFRELEVVADPQAEPITELIDYEVFCGVAVADDISPGELAAQLRGEQPPVLVDVREDWEVEIVAIPGARLTGGGDISASVHDLPVDAPLAILCHHGVRSTAAATRLRDAGFTSVRAVSGGIDAWAREVDPGLPRY